MKLFLYVLALFFALSVPVQGQVSNSKIKKNNDITFTENLGQVSDQNYKSRPDVLYSGTDGKIVYHIKKSGVSYQLNRFDLKKGKKNSKTDSNDEINKTTIYRIDANWLNANNNFTVTKGNALTGTTNYYLSNCPNGIHNVKTYMDVTLKNIYNSIDLHYYGKEGVLKYDFIVAPHADYEQIQIEIKGARINLQSNGNVLLITPFGTIAEGAPVVYQDGKRLKASWVLKNNTLSFKILGYNSNSVLIIDPPTRIWGTYYGGTQTDGGEDCVTDKYFNVYMTGKASSLQSLVIATVGSHQSGPGGGAGDDGFLAKFDPSGSRIWATYYGGVGNDVANACALDTAGNVFICGTSSYITTSGISSSGAFQTVHGGGIRDAFLVKFNSAGVRQWGTYYGGNDDDYGEDCATDKTGNVYLAGTSRSTNTITIASPGGHQTSFGGVDDGFLAKFNSTGTRLWGTYYGGTGTDEKSCCAVDTAGNVYLAGGASLTTAMTTVGSYQPNHPGLGSIAAYLTKFDSNGTRLWGTFYASAGLNRCAGIAASKFGYIYICGSAGNVPSVYASANCHQQVSGGGGESFLAKFNLSGQRVWGTFYGGSGTDAAYACAADNLGNVYFAGFSGSTNNIATSTAHQTTVSGGLGDAFLVKFDSLGMREWGTYYGESCDDHGSSCASDNNSNVYLTGYTGYKVGNNSPYSGTVLATPGSQQITFGGAFPSSTNAFLVKFFDCQGFNLSVSSISLTCPNVPSGVASVTATGSSGYTYMWSPSGGNASTASNLTAGVYTSAVTNSCGIVRTKTVQVVGPTPFSLNASANNTLICPGLPSTLTASGSGGTGPVTFSWVAGPTGTLSVVNPTTTSIYTIQITDSYSCTQTKTIQVSTKPLPLITLSSGTVCSGNSFSLNASGAQTYTYINGAAVVTPTISTTYSVMGTGTNGCASLNPALTTVTVFANPVLSVSGTQTICNGATTTLQVSGASSYFWNNSTNASTISVAPIVNTSFTVQGIDVLGCKTTLYPVVIVNNLPSVNIVSPASVCIGNTITLNATGAVSYTWNTNSNATNISVSPVVNTTYSLIGVDANGCKNTATKNIVINSLPFVFAQCSNTLICSGDQVIFNGLGALTYTWTGGVVNNQPFAPPSSASYSVIGSDVNGCQNSSSINIIVKSSPTLTCIWDSVICIGEPVVLNVNGANIYSWSTGQNQVSITVIPTVTTVYTVTGTAVNGCIDTTLLKVNVDPCTSINEIRAEKQYGLYPNPSDGICFITLPDISEQTIIEIFNSIGQKIYSTQPYNTKHVIDIKNYANGLYLLRVIENGIYIYQKNIIKNQ